MDYIIIGTGNISNTYFKAIENLDNSQVVGLISRSGKSLSGKKGLPSWIKLSEVDIPFDAVIITTPNGLHCQSIIEAAYLGKPTLTEKALGIDLKNIDAALHACRQNGVPLAVAFQRRTAPDNQAIKALLDKGAFGKIYAADLSAKFYRDQAYYDSADYRGGYAIDGGGPFMQQACHQIDIYQWFFGLPQKVVSMLDTFAHDMEAEDHGAAILRHDRGMIGTIIASTAARPGFPARLEVHTEKGSFILTDDRITFWAVDGIENPADQSFQYEHDGSKSASVSDTSAHEAILKNFEAMVSEGVPAFASGESARKTTDLILRIYGRG